MDGGLEGLWQGLVGGSKQKPPDSPQESAGTDLATLWKGLAGGGKDVPKPQQATPAPPDKPAEPSERRSILSTLWEGIKSAGGAEEKGAAEASTAMAPAVKQLAKPIIDRPSPLEMPERTEGTLAQRALDPEGLAKATAIAGAIGPAAIGKGITQHLTDATRDFQIKVAPMTTGSEPAMAIAKDFANSERGARYQRSLFDDKLKKFKPNDLEEMWHAADAASVAEQTVGSGAGKRFLNTLSKPQQAVIDDMEKHAGELWDRARAAGVVDASAQRIPYYTTRAILNIDPASGAASRIPNAPGQGAGASPLDMLGLNLRTRGTQRRSFLTSEETEQAAQARFGPQAKIIRDMRAVPYALERFETAINGRELINDIEQLSNVLGRPTISANPAQGFFTLPHPAMMKTRPRFTVDPSGKTVPVRDTNGEIIFDRTPIYVAKEFEGPLRAVLRGDDGALYRGAMSAKAGAMSLIMNSPMIHNMVEWGRALPVMPGKVATFRIYGDGKRFMENPADMKDAIAHGFVPIGHRGFLQDIQGIAEDPGLEPGRSLTAKAVGGLVGMGSKQAGESVKRAIDVAGDFWHNKLLWDQVAKLQAGIYSNMLADLTKKGIAPEGAKTIAAHFANRYAGALPHEAMGQTFRKVLNFVLFSRSFTMGNLGVMKDMINGLPRDVRAQLGSSMTSLERSAATSAARRKAIGTFMMDVALFYAGNSLLQNGLQLMRGDKDLSDIEKGYLDRFEKLANRAKESPLDVLNPFGDLEALSATSESEPGKEDRVLLGHEPDGTAIYGRNPTGKIGEEFAGWMTQPLQQIRNKEGTIVRPLLNLLNIDRGFGKKVYDPDAKGIGGVAKNVGRIAYEFVRAQIPETQILAAVKMMSPQDRSWLNAGQALSPFFGTSISKGAPGGEAVGELYSAKRQAHERQQEAMPAIDEMIRSGNKEQAKEEMRKLGMSPGFVKWRLRVIEHPSTRLSPKQMQEFKRYATPEEQAKMQQFRGGKPSGDLAKQVDELESQIHAANRRGDLKEVRTLTRKLRDLAPVH